MAASRRPPPATIGAVHEFLLINRGIGITLGLVFPALVVGMAVAYAVITARERRQRDERKDDGRSP